MARGRKSRALRTGHDQGGQCASEKQDPGNFLASRKQSVPKLQLAHRVTDDVDVPVDQAALLSGVQNKR